ncbi:restriction endonuclease [Streptomyces viridochromogenes]|uniref:restriction endonuclease n=1 Tax=Streptomyces viridochromogenes TaxID=1938 RepID=UPI00117E7704|nr:restriction endonuclease [Streptomyces viridochromogenes]
MGRAIEQAEDRIAESVKARGGEIYGAEEQPSSPAFYANAALQNRLNDQLVGESLAGLPLRTRSKRAKEIVCRALGYSVPTSFKKTQPRFPAVNLDIYVQKANNLQIWNEEVDPTRRYAIIRLDSQDVIASVRVLSGQELALLDTTGTLTSKYQAKLRHAGSSSILVSPKDTENFNTVFQPTDFLALDAQFALSPIDRPTPRNVLTISALYDRLRQLEGYVFTDPGVDQERLRGVRLQQRVCELLRLSTYADGGQFPDILCQALEVKLQLSPTVDLGLVSPDSTALAKEIGPGVQYRDSRYAVVYAKRTEDKRILVESVVLTTGRDFFTAFQRFEGNVQNKKLQIHLPPDFFDVH